MLKVNLKKILLNSIIISVIFLIDRISKIYILKIAELENKVDIYLTPYLNLYLIWNKGIAFGLFSFEKFFIYQSISLVIFIISIVLIVMIIKSEGFKKYSLILILGGALGNLFDRVYYSAVPDFIDLHMNGFHWFIFNVADIFITIGVICLILDELFFYKKNNETS
jgi:signal peptidase II|tara:strand:+ start:242 stop:739 length:498 start_codon:yes stop_codon:yes gene_type:complete